MTPIPIYPEVELREDRIQTLVRKKHTDGKWYLTRVMERILLNPSAPVEETDRIKEMMKERFYRLVYLFILYGKIDPDLTFDNGLKAYPPDQFQGEEYERLNLSPYESQLIK